MLGAFLGLVFGPLGVVAIAAMEGLNPRHNAYSRLVAPSTVQVAEHMGYNNDEGWSLIGMTTEQAEAGNIFHFTWESLG